MKTINVTFTDKEYKQLITMKQDFNWHNFILKLVERGYHWQDGRKTKYSSPTNK